MTIKKKTIFAAVDRLGIKPLYYYFCPKEDFLLITSDYSHLVKHKIVKLEINKDALMSFVCLGRTLGKKTIYKNIHDLEPGNMLSYGGNKSIKVQKYWNHFRKSKINLASKKSRLVKFEKKFVNINNLWKISETSISNTLSSGMDSNLVDYALIKNNIKAKRFSIIEGQEKKINKNNSKIYKKKINRKIVLKELFNYVVKNKNPFVLANTGSISLFQLYKKINKEKIKVSFTGEGGDEVFGGYERYKKQLRLIKKDKIKFNDHYLELYKKEINLFSKFNSFYKPISTLQKLKKSIKLVSLKSKNIKNRILEFDQKTWLPMLLKKHDSIGMHYSIEVRPQILDDEIVKFINNEIPASEKFNYKENKIFLKSFFLKFKKKKFKSKKTGTPTLVDNIFNSSNNIFKFKKIILESDIVRKYFSNLSGLDKNLFNKKNHVFLWRLFVISIMFSNKKNKNEL